VIESLRDIGKFSLHKKGLSPNEPLAILLENPGTKENYEYSLSINFKTINGDLKFDFLDREPIDKNNYHKYLYKRKGAAGANYTPGAFVASKGIEGTFATRILGWAKSNKNQTGVVGKLSNAIEKNVDQIIAELKERAKYEDLSNLFLTVKVDNKFLGEFDEFKDYFIKTYFAKKTEISSENGYCSVCGKQKFVMGDEKPWTFYSLDKPGFIASGFEKKYGWRNFPICTECSLLVTEGKHYVEDQGNLSFRFAGIPYFLLPKTILGKRETMFETLWLMQQIKKRKINISDFQQLSDDEDIILQIASEQKDIINYNFLFYKSAKAKFSILLYLQDVLPSTIKRLFIAKQRVEKISLFNNAYKDKGESRNIIFTFANLKRFVKDIKPFLNLVEKIFKDRPISYYFLMEHIIKYLRNSFVNGSYTKPDTLRAWQILILINALNLYKDKISGGFFMTNDLIINEVKKKVDKFFSQFQESFDTAEKRAIFLTGVLTDYLLKIQRIDRNSNPFMKQLKGLKMRANDIIDLFPKVQNKLEEYGKNYYRQLEEIIAEYFVRAGTNWKISENEINFYFLMGMDLSNAKTESGESTFKAKSEEKIEKESIE
jgi:CRISPR-associated protein Csh1